MTEVGRTFETPTAFAVLWRAQYPDYSVDERTDECGAVGRMRIGRGKRRIRRSAVVPRHEPRGDLSWDETRVPTMGSWRHSHLEHVSLRQ
jgi:hypothetical protein